MRNYNKLTEASLAQVVDNLTNLRMSCQEGLDGTWDCSTEEGREGFEAMIDACDEIAKLLGIELPIRYSNGTIA